MPGRQARGHRRALQEVAPAQVRLGRGVSKRSLASGSRRSSMAPPAFYRTSGRLCSSSCENSRMDLGLEGKVALVTGASKGLGRATAEACRRGRAGGVSSRSRERIDAAARPSARDGFVHDIADLDNAAALIDAVEADLGPIDILVTNTGGPPINPDPLAHARGVGAGLPRAGARAHGADRARGARDARAGFGRVLNVSSTARSSPSPRYALQRPPRRAAHRVQDPRARGGRRRRDAQHAHARPLRHGPPHATIGGRENAEAAAADTRPGAWAAGGVRRRGGFPVLDPRRLHHRGGAARRRRLTRSTWARPCAVQAAWA